MKARPRALSGTKGRTRSSVLSTQSSGGPPAGMVAIIVGGRVKYVPRPGYVAEKVAKPARWKPAKATSDAPAGPTFDPRLAKHSRELRDRYLERVNGEQADGGWLAAPRGKYEVSRVAPPARRSVEGRSVEGRTAGGIRAIPSKAVGPRPLGLLKAG